MFPLFPWDLPCNLKKQCNSNLQQFSTKWQDSFFWNDHCDHLKAEIPLGNPAHVQQFVLPWIFSLLKKKKKESLHLLWLTGNLVNEVMFWGVQQHVPVDIRDDVIMLSSEYLESQTCRVPTKALNPAAGCTSIGEGLFSICVGCSPGLCGHRLHFCGSPLE